VKVEERERGRRQEQEGGRPPPHRSVNGLRRGGAGQFGIKTIRPKKSATGDLILEIPGVDSARKADELASFLRGVAGKDAGVRITRPVKRVDLRLAGLAQPVTSKDAIS